MPPPRFRSVVLALLFGLGGLAAGPNRAAAAGSALIAADKHYAQHSYRAALGEYRAALSGGGIPAARRTEVEYRIAVSLGRTRQWDEALAAGLAFPQAHRDTVWEARGLWSLGQLYQRLPAHGYRLGGRVFLGDNVPAVPRGSSDRPVRVSFASTRMQDEREALEAAHLIYSRLHTAATTIEEMRLDFELARFLQSDERTLAWYLKPDDWPKPSDPALAIRPDAPYSVNWPPPQKVFTLYAHIRILAGRGGAEPARPGTEAARRSSLAALSLYAEAGWLRQYLSAMRNYGIRIEGERRVPIPYPYQDRDPLALLRQIERDYPNDQLADRAGYAIGTLFAADGKFGAAAAEYRGFAAARPKSPWTPLCRAALDALHHRWLSLGSPGPYYPNSRASIEVSARNADGVRLQLYRAPLDRWLADPRRLADPEFTIQNAAGAVLGPKMRIASLGRPAAVWTRRIPDRGLFALQVAHVSLPLAQSGAYVLVGSTPGVRAAQLLLRTRLALVQRLDRDRALYFTADAITGRPVPGAAVLAREFYEEPHGKDGTVQRVAIVRGVTGADGSVALPIARKPNRSGFAIEAAAWRGADFAVTGREGCGDYEDNVGRFKTYGTTDRSVYRPSQTVNFREMVLERSRAGMAPARGRRIHVEAFDARGRRIYASLLTTSEFGSVHGQFALPPDAPLGEYAVKCSVFKVEAAGTDNGGSQFRVEEYRKPEFQVSVTPDAGRVRLGQPAAAIIRAAYYFGGPAAGARVTYRVHRTIFAQTYAFPTPFDFLYADASQGGYDTDYRNGEVVEQGTATTDAKGEARVSFVTKPDTMYRDSDFTYTVEADVRDSSRRTITGTGAVKATRHDVGVFLNYPHGYTHAGDRAPIEIVSLNASDVPVSVEGRVRVFRESAVENGKERLAAEMPMATDAHGRAIFNWTPGRAGFYRIAFVTRDSDGGEVVGSTVVWVAGVELSRGDFFARGITLAIEQPYYQEGQTARLLIATQAPNCTVLLTREANNQILERRLVHVSGRSAEIPIPLSHADVPNVFINAVTIRNGEALEASQELFVPPVSQLAKVSVAADQPAYRPGEKATFHLTATDWHGRPLRAELAVSISDAALAYIQKAYAPDIRVYYFGDRRSQSVQSANSTGTAFNGLALDLQPVRNYELQGGRYRLSWGVTSGSITRLAGDGVAGVNTDPWNAVQRSTGYGAIELETAVPDGFYGLSPARPVGLRGGRLMARSTGTSIRGPVVDYEGGVESVAAQLKRPATLHTPGFAPLTMTPQSITMRAYGLGFIVPKSEEGPRGVPGPPAVRKQFLDTAFWTPAAVTDGAGHASVNVTWPDNLTQWRAYAAGNSAAGQVGTAETSVTTRKDLIVRLETPRYFVERDTMLLTAVVRNDSAADAAAHVTLDLSGDTLEVLSVAASPDAAPGTGSGPAELGAERPAPRSLALNSGRASAPTSPEGRGDSPIDVAVPAGGERRIDWRVRVLRPGAVRIRATAQAAAAGDAAETVVPVLVHGVERALAASGELHGGDGAAIVPITLPQARKAGTSELVVQLNPSLAAVMLDALPYLNDYPYGCVEQTMSRFLPSVLTQRILKEQGYRLEDLRRRAGPNAPSRSPLDGSPVGAGRGNDSPFPVSGANEAGKGAGGLGSANEAGKGAGGLGPANEAGKGAGGLGPASEAANGTARSGPAAESAQGAGKSGRSAESARGSGRSDSPYTYPAGKPGVDPLPVDRTADPVFDSRKLAKMVRAGLDRLADFQHADGGWGWWKDDATDTWMTAYVVYGLIQAREAGVAIDGERLRRAEQLLARRLRAGLDRHEAAFVSRVLALEPARRAEVRPLIAGPIYERRDVLSAYSRAHLALALAAVGERAKADVVLGNLENTVQTDAQAATAHWGAEGDGWWRWYDDPVETTAAALQAYLAIRPGSPMPAMIVKWLVDRRQGDDWSNTRATALTVYALSDYVRKTHELSPDYTLTVDLGGRVRRTYHISRENALLFDNRFVVPDAFLQTGEQPLTITKRGQGACYYTVYTRFFSQEESIPASGNGIFVTRRYYRLTPGTASGAAPPPKIDTNRQNPFLAGRYDLLAELGAEEAPVDTEAGPTYERTALADGDTVTSGDLIEVELQLDAKNDYSYLAFEDVKPAGCEPVEVRSGEKEGLGICANFELRDQKAVFFLTSIPQGTRSVRYRLRAEAPGAFHALPTNGYAMYAPALRTLSAEQTLQIRDE
ncbi:MAG TPA: MG2 domain-containing protein [Chthonomonadaceae bacterium]|nr:MG2 domain-containing protein [Chthonomonadaceae bacterium]